MRFYQEFMNSCFYLLTSTHNVSLMYHNEKHRTHGPRWLLALVHREKHLHIKSTVDVSCMGLASVHCLRVAVERFLSENKMCFWIKE